MKNSYMMVDGKEDSVERWRYVIIACKFTHHLLEAAISKSFGVLIPEMVDLFRTNVSVLGLVCSFPVTWMLMACPVLAYALSHNGVNTRGVAVFGGLIASSCLIAAGFTRSIVAFGIYLALCGIGMATTFMPALLTLNEFYPNGFILVDNVAQMGGICGILTFPIILERCNRAYGYSGAMLILGGAAANSVAAGFATISPKHVKSDTTYKDHRNDGSWKGDKIKPCKNTEAIRDSLEMGEDENESSEDLSEPCLPPAANRYIEVHRSDEYDQQEEKEESDLQKRSSQYQGYMSYNPDYIIVEDAGREAEDSDSSNCSDIEQINSDDAIYLTAESSEGPRNKSSKYPSRWNAISQWFLNSIFFEDPLFTLQLPVLFLIQFGTYSWILFLVPRAEWLGIESSHAVLLSSIGGSGALVGRLFLLAILYRGANPFHICCLASSVVIVTCMVDPLVKSFSVMCCIAFLQGWALFTNTALGSAFCKMSTSDRNFGIGSAYGALAVGIGGNVGGATSGLIFHLTRSYTTVFMVIGGVHCLIIINIIVYLMVVHHRQTSQKDAL